MPWGSGSLNPLSKTKGHPLCFTGRSLHPGKRGQIAERIPKLLQRLAIDPERFIDCATDLMKQFGSAVGAAAHLTELCAQRQVKYLRGINAARGAFGQKAA